MRKIIIVILILSGIVFASSAYLLLHGIKNNTGKDLLVVIAMLTISMAIIPFIHSFLLEISKKYYSLKENVIIQMNTISKAEESLLKDNDTSIENETVSTKTSNQLSELKSLLSKNKNFEETSNQFLNSLAHSLELVQGEIYLKPDLNSDSIRLSANYAYYNPEGKTPEFKIGEGLIGQVAKMGNILKLENLPANYMTVASGLGKASPSNLMISPIKNDNTIFGVIEIASFKSFSNQDERFILEAGKLYFEFLKSIDRIKNDIVTNTLNSETENTHSND